MKRLLPWFALLIPLVGFGVAFALGVFAEPVPPAGRSWGGGAVPAVVWEVQPRTFSVIAEAIGTTQAWEHADLSAAVTEEVVAFSFEEGQLVEAGQILVQLDRAVVEAELAEALAAIDEARSELERRRSLRESGGVSRSSIEQAQATFLRSEAQLASIEAQLAEGTIRAPFSGVVGRRDFSIGSLVVAGDSLVSVLQIDKLRLDFSLPETLFGGLRTGMKIEATSDALADRAFTGTVYFIAPQINPDTRSVELRASLDNADLTLRPGMLFRVRAILDEAELLAVPEAALTVQGPDSFVMVVDPENVATRRKVQTAQRQNGLVAVVAGLQAGEAVVTEGFKVRPGATVEIVEPPPEVGDANDPSALVRTQPSN